MKRINEIVGGLLILFSVAEGINTHIRAVLTEDIVVVLVVICIIGFILIYRSVSTDTPLVRIGNYLYMLLAIVLIIFHYNDLWYLLEVFNDPAFE